MSDIKQVKVDNWGIYFLQRLKHFFNRTDYCDLTLQFQDNAQLKVHRLVLNACTEYFELLERTCEMYEDCLVMPDDLQADVVVPIVNFMYTGQLEFKMDSLEKLYQTSLVMNMPVLTKLLEVHRSVVPKAAMSQNYGGVKKIVKSVDSIKQFKYAVNSASSSGKRSYSKAFDSHKSPTSSKFNESPKSAASLNTNELKNKQQQIVSSKVLPRDKKTGLVKKIEIQMNNGHSYRPPSPIPLNSELYSKKLVLGDPRPTRYELPEELDTENIFENSFSNISYTSKPLMIHPETTKQYTKRNNMFGEPSSSKKIMRGPSTIDIVECKKIGKDDSLFIDSSVSGGPEDEMFQSAYLSVKEETARDPNQLFDQILDNNDEPKVTIEGKDKQSGTLDHAKIISEVLKKYPHLVKSNKNIKLKILNTPAKAKKPRPFLAEEKVESKAKSELGFTYETDVLNSKEAAKLIAMGAENVKGPWICLICGTPGKALNFSSYYSFRRHLIEIHKEKPLSTICEYCGLRSAKRNYLLHHTYTKHGVPPPPQYHFPKCNLCDYVALTEGFLVKHKLTHSDAKITRCNVCLVAFTSTLQLLHHYQKSGHKLKFDKKSNFQCVYCMKVFLRESNFYVHLKTNHKEAAIRDGIVEDSDEERMVESPRMSQEIKTKYERTNFDNEYEDSEIQYQIHQRSDGNIQVSKKPTSRASLPNTKHKILNAGFNPHSKMVSKPKVVMDNELSQDTDDNPSPQTIDTENIVFIDGNEYIMKDDQLIPSKSAHKPSTDEYNIQDYAEPESNTNAVVQANITPTNSIDFSEDLQQSKIVMKNANLNQPIQIVVSNEEEYKALMSSNHSIIFDDGDTNKTLTVLSTPNTSTIDGTGIDLVTSQANDMMIIQEDFPLNVSEGTVAGDSKYVVVYSHAVGENDAGKQYQIITPEGIGTQYVQAAEVIPQNFETVTTSNIVMNTESIINAQIEDSWPTQEQSSNSIATMHIVAEHNINNDKNSQIIEQADDTTIVQLPEVQLSSTTFVSMQEETVTMDEVQNNVVHTDENIEITTNREDQVIVDEIQNHEIVVPMDVDVSSSLIVEENCQENNLSNAVISQNEEEINSVEIDTTQNDVPLVEESQLLINETNNQDDVNTSEVMDESASVASPNVCDSTSVAPPNVCESTEDFTETKAVEIETKNVPESAHIQNIASEWSEDEYDTREDLEPHPNEEPEPLEPKTSNELTTSTTEQPELEETIENIQQEVQQQFLVVSKDSVMEVGVPGVSTQKVEVSGKKETENLLNLPNQEKISSLLNDWEDSQEENTSSNGNTEDVSNSNENSKAEDTEIETLSEDKTETLSEDKIKTKKDDKIKSLVSDWDDEDEEEAKK